MHRLHSTKVILIGAEAGAGCHMLEAATSGVFAVSDVLLLHGSCLERSSKADLMRSVSKRHAGSIHNARRALIQPKHEVMA
jgi:hypothetical protein